MTAARALVLASASPRRAAILEQLGVAFEADVADVPEIEAGEPAEVASENAARKAVAVAQRRPRRTVLGADTVVAAGSSSLGKPADVEEARAFLEALSGVTHSVLSGVCVVGDDQQRRDAVVKTDVRFRRLGPAEIDWYLATGEWTDKAGGYGIQGKGAALVSEIHGEYLNVVGLPSTALLELIPERIVGRR